jgi:hypothetical protein
MKPRGSWYFDGYQREQQLNEDGTTRSVLVYRGEYYGFAQGLELQKKQKIQTTIAVVVCYLTYFYAQLTPAAGGMDHIVALPGILALVPMLFLTIGMFNFWMAKEKWEIRVFYAGYRRVTRWGIALLVLVALWAAAEVGFLLAHLSLFVSELHYLLAALVSVAAAAWLVYLVRKYPAIVIEGPTVR